MRLAKDWAKAKPVFDEGNLVSHAGLAPVMGLAEKAGLSRLLGDRLDLGATRVASAGANPAAKAAAVIAGMAAGADCIDDLDVCRAGGMDRMFGGCTRRRRWGSSCASSPPGMCGSWARPPESC